VRHDGASARTSASDARAPALVLPYGEALGSQPGGELRLHAGGDSVRQAREALDQVETESEAVGLDEAAGLRAAPGSLEARFGLEAADANVQASALRAAGIAGAEGAMLPDVTIELDGVEAVAAARPRARRHSCAYGEELRFQPSWRTEL